MARVRHLVLALVGGLLLSAALVPGSLASPACAPTGTSLGADDVAKVTYGSSACDGAQSEGLFVTGPADEEVAFAGARESTETSFGEGTTRTCTTRDTGVAVAGAVVGHRRAECAASNAWTETEGQSLTETYGVMVDDADTWAGVQHTQARSDGPSGWLEGEGFDAGLSSPGLYTGPGVHLYQGTIHYEPCTTYSTSYVNVVGIHISQNFHWPSCPPVPRPLLPFLP